MVTEDSASNSPFLNFLHDPLQHGQVVLQVVWSTLELNPVVSWLTLRHGCVDVEAVVFEQSVQWGPVEYIRHGELEAVDEVIY